MKAPDYKRLFESTSGPYVVFDQDLRVVAASNAYLRATGAQSDSLIGKPVWEAFPEKNDTPRASLERVFREGRPHALHLERGWTMLNLPIFGDDGRVEYVISRAQGGIGGVHGIPEPLHRAVDVEAIGVMFFNAAGRLIDANDTLLRWTGYSRQDLATQTLTWQELTPPEYHEASRAELERLARTGRIGPYEKEYLTKDGGRRWMLFVGTALPDGTVLEYAIDISERKRAEQAQRETEARYRMLFDSIDVGFCIIEMIYDAEGKPVDYRFLEANPAFERQTGLKDASRKTRRADVPQHEQHWFDIYAKVAESGESMRFIDAAKPLMGGWYEVNAFRVGGPGSGRVGILFNDITERMQALEKLKESDRRKDEFLAALAHELRNPLAPIRSAVSFLRLKGPKDPEMEMMRRIIDRQVDHLVHLVDDLVDISRITFDKVALRREPLDLAAVAQEAVTTSRPLIDEAGHRLSVRLPDEPVWVHGDRVRLAQVAANLLNNAARYTPPGGEVSLELRAVDGEAVLAVRDNGIGIAPEMLERVFDPFMQINHPRAGRAAGIGIGLSLARKLVELHAGSIVAESEGLGRGSRFVVRMPLADAPLATSREFSTAAGESRRRFLVVDDNIDAAVSQAAVLRMLGHDAETACNGTEALEKAAGFCPDVVLLDLGMPGMDGFEVARRLRDLPQGRQARLIAQTGWSQEEDRRRTAAAGFDAHLAKPVEMGALMQALRDLGPT